MFLIFNFKKELKSSFFIVGFFLIFFIRLVICVIFFLKKGLLCPLLAPGSIYFLTFFLLSEDSGPPTAFQQPGISTLLPTLFELIFLTMNLALALQDPIIFELSVHFSSVAQSCLTLCEP